MYQYTLLEEGISYYSGGPMYLIKKDELEIDDLKKVTLIFSEDTKVLLYVCAKFKQNKFESLYENLSKKYRLIEEQRPFVGNQQVVTSILRGRISCDEFSVLT